ncbi:putative serine/threonine-protein kinase [Tetrabaena socialis]|uniref:Putative serine/threonine-protein kinase n=1 Tax=Tetrabaena socialis TaxID=47790 RepID=A0A2J7ZRH9_9CHLO|nr:putative serine/threonine-protein kinase [Tetrabaena socialis]|eukprot:PNH02874.1 putative serine/threonine-protein kinase [Tetrabaena socialis]
MLRDFGLSVKLDAGRSQHSHTYGGTPHYMAPERARGILAQRSDVYSLGVCLWELYCGTPPWRRNAPAGHNNCGGGGGSGRYGDDGTADSQSSGESYALPSPYEPGAAPPAAYGAGGSEVFRFPRSCPPEFSGLVTSCLAADLGERPDAGAVLAALARMQQRYGQ